MGVFSSGEAGIGMGSQMHMPERCKPDYEAQIARIKKAIEVTGKLFDALLEYGEFHGSGPRAWEGKNQYPGLVGALLIEQRANERVLQEVMAAYEANG
jgi:hypothetical protein